jgi:CheY-like chemotaxis protein
MQDDLPTTSPSCRILVADDNRDVAESLAILLQMDGHDVTVVTDGAEALTAITRLQPHIALLDIGLPTLDGYEVAARVRQNTGFTTMLVAITGWGQPADKARAIAAGFDQHYTKPVEPEVIAALCRQISSGFSKAKNQKP